MEATHPTEPMSKDADFSSWDDCIRLLPAGNIAPLPPCKLTYDLIWNQSMRAGKAEITIGGDPDPDFPDAQLVTVEAQTVGMARIMYSFNVTHQAIIDRATGRPLRTQQVQKLGKNATSHKTRFSPEGAVTDTEKFEKGMVEKKEDQKFPCAQAYDLVSTVLYVRDVAAKCDDQVHIPVLVLNKGYLASLQLVGREEVKSLGETTEGYKLQLAISQPDETMKSHTDRLKSAYCWFSGDEKRLPVEIRVETELGTVDVKLAKAEML